MYKSIKVYKGRFFAVMSVVLLRFAAKSSTWLGRGREHLTIYGVSMILSELYGVLVGLRRFEFLATAKHNHNGTTLLCLRNS